MNTLNAFIPLPQKVSYTGEFFKAEQLKSFYVAPEFAFYAPAVKELLEGFDFAVDSTAAPDQAQLKLCFAECAPESFTLSVTPEAITLTAGCRAGALYAVNACRQMLFCALIKGAENAVLDCGYVEDAPRFAMRSMLLDSSRHFQSVKVIKQYLKLMAEFRLNTFHWHLVDSQGWRLQLKSTAGLENCYTNTPGFYTTEDIREITALADSLAIEIIPEIDVPGHSRGTLKFFPQYACVHAEHPTEFCLGNPEGEEFIKNIFAEVMELFPSSKYIHIGGDEADTANWDKCPRCREAMQKENCDNMRELENKFMNRIADFILQNNRKPIIWGTCSGQTYSKEVTIQSWLDIREPLKAAANGNPVIYSVHTSLYFDYPANLSEPWETWMFELSERGVYMCDPYIIWPDKVKDVTLGTEACLWTETVPQWRVIQKLLPRLYAYSECAWSKVENKDYSNFVQRKELLEAAGYQMYLAGR